MHTIAVVIFVAWIAFWIYWFAAAVGVKAGRTRMGQFVGFRVAIFVLLLLLVRANLFRGTVTQDPVRQAIGLVLFVAGLALAVWARLYIGRNWGTPMSEKVDPELVRTGPYERVRHPIYSGIILAMIGTAVAVAWYWLIVAALIGGYFVYSATREERYMAGQFPDTYPEYQRSSKMFVPYVF